VTGRGSLERPGFARFVTSWALPILDLIAGQDYRDAARIPKQGPAIFVVNHVSKIDPVLMARFLWRQGRMFRFLAKQQLFEAPILGRFLHGLQLIPVDRASGGGHSLQEAQDWIARGTGVVIYPEGTLTRDPDLWPMRGHPGMVRLCLETGAPLIPLAQWGGQDILPRYAKRLHLVPRKQFHVQAGNPIPASTVRDWVREDGVRGATDRIMLQITSLLEQLRGPKPPRGLWSPRHGSSSDGEGNS
jgi:1-acyl-sn-glycerol-3-phosphate acyltransferase